MSVFVFVFYILALRVWIARVCVAKVVNRLGWSKATRGGDDEMTVEQTIAHSVESVCECGINL